MGAYILRRILMLPVILFGVTVLVCALLSQLSPGQRAALYVSRFPKTADGVQRVIDRYGLNDPIPLQYVR